AGPSEPVAQARDQGGADHKPDASQAKGPGEPQAKLSPSQGQVKGQEPDPAKGECKNGGQDGGDGQKAAAKGAGGDSAKGGPPRAENKAAAPAQSRDAGLAKGDRRTPGQAAAKNEPRQ